MLQTKCANRCMSDAKQREIKRTLREFARGKPSVKSDDLTEKFLSLKALEKAKVIMLYVGTGDESDTIPLIEHLLKTGKRVVLPRCLAERQMELCEITAVSDLVPGKFKIPEPGQHCPVVAKESIDIALVPYVLCDREGYRLGHGGGYYDRWLSDFAGLTVAICSRERFVEKLPRETHDQPVNCLIVV